MIRFDVEDTNDFLQNSVNIDAVCKALADPIRRSLLKVLGEKQYFCYVDGELVNGVCVQDLSEVLTLPQSTVSRHLTLLRQADLVGHQQKGVWHYYFCRAETLRAVNHWFQSLVPADSGVGVI